MTGTAFQNTILENCTFEDCRMQYANFAEATFREVRFVRCDLTETSFAALKKKSKPILTECELVKTDFTDTSLAGLDIRSCHISSLTLRLEDVKGMIVSPEQALYFAAMMGLKIR